MYLSLSAVLVHHRRSFQGVLLYLVDTSAGFGWLRVAHDDVALKSSYLDICTACESTCKHLGRVSDSRSRIHDDWRAVLL